MSTRNPRRALAPLAALTALILAGCGTQTWSPAAGGEDSGPADQETVALTDAQGREVEVPLNPETVVVTDWSLIRTLNDLGVEVDAVPAAAGGLPEDLAAYAEGGDAEIVGSVREPDYEAISALEPDLVIIGSRTGTPEVLAEMERITPNVVDLSTRWERPDEQLELTEQRILQVASIFGKEDQAQQRMDDVREHIEAAGSAAAESGHTAMFVQVSGGTVSAYGPGSRFGIVHDAFGYADTGAPVNEEGDHGQEISQEFFAEYDPDVIFVLDRSRAIGEESSAALDVLDNGLVNDTSAARGERIVEVDGFSWYLASNAPSSLERMVSDVELVQQDR